LATVQREHEELIADDPEKRTAYLDRRAISRDKAEVAQEKAEAKRLKLESEQKLQAASLAVKAVEVSREYGISISDLESCGTEEAMENKGLKFQLTKLGEAKEPEKEAPQFDSGVSSAGGGGTLTAEQVMKMSPEERFARAEEIAKIPMGYTSLAK